MIYGKQSTNPVHKALLKGWLDVKHAGLAGLMQWQL
jgi:hypothetical protein